MLFSHVEIDLITCSLDSVQNFDDLLKGSGKLSVWSAKAFVTLIDFLESWNTKQILDFKVSSSSIHLSKKPIKYLLLVTVQYGCSIKL